MQTDLGPDEIAAIETIQRRTSIRSKPDIIRLALRELARTMGQEAATKVDPA